MLARDVFLVSPSRENTVLDPQRDGPDVPSDHSEPLWEVYQWASSVLVKTQRSDLKLPSIGLCTVHVSMSINTNTSQGLPFGLVV